MTLNIATHYEDIVSNQKDTHCCDKVICIYRLPWHLNYEPLIMKHLCFPENSYEPDMIKKEKKAHLAMAALHPHNASLAL